MGEPRHLLLAGLLKLRFRIDAPNSNRLLRNDGYLVRSARTTHALNFIVIPDVVAVLSFFSRYETRSTPNRRKHSMKGSGQECSLFFLLEMEPGPWNFLQVRIVADVLFLTFLQVAHMVPCIFPAANVEELVC